MDIRCTFHTEPYHDYGTLVLEGDIITIKKNIDLVSLSQRIHFFLDVFQMTVIVFVSVINRNHINEWYLF